MLFHPERWWRARQPMRIPFPPGYFELFPAMVCQSIHLSVDMPRANCIRVGPPARSSPPGRYGLRSILRMYSLNINKIVTWRIIWPHCMIDSLCSRKIILNNYNISLSLIFHDISYYNAFFHVLHLSFSIIFIIIISYITYLKKIYNKFLNNIILEENHIKACGTNAC